MSDGRGIADEWIGGLRVAFFHGGIVGVARFGGAGCSIYTPDSHTQECVRTGRTKTTPAGLTTLIKLPAPNVCRNFPNHLTWLAILFGENLPRPKRTGIPEAFQLVVYCTLSMGREGAMRLLLRDGRASGEGGSAASMPRFWRALGALVLGALLAKWCWVLFAPHSEAVFVAPPQEASTEAERLFGVATVPAVAATVAVAMPNARLLGVFSGSPGFAVLEMDGKRQEAVALGNDAAPGVRLVEVAADYVVLERAGVQQRVNLEGQAAALASAKSATVARGNAKPGG